MKLSKKTFLLFLTFGSLVGFSLSPFVLQKVEQGKIYKVEDVPETEVAIVFGAGIGKAGGPSDALYDRLTVASQLYKAGKIQKILVSGDNSKENYNEPDVMRTTLENAFAIPSAVIAEDYAGFRTFDTCIRAKTLWSVDSAILVTQDFHLPRALYTCNSLGVSSVGVSASLQPYVMEPYYESREYLATLKMGVDLYIWSPSYLSGEKESW